MLYPTPTAPPTPGCPHLGLGVEEGFGEELDGEVGTHEAGAGLVREAEGPHDGLTPGCPLPDGHRADPGWVPILQD